MRNDTPKRPVVPGVLTERSQYRRDYEGTGIRGRSQHHPALLLYHAAYVIKEAGSVPFATDPNYLLLIVRVASRYLLLEIE